MVFFYLPLFISVAFVLSVEVYPTVDGPAHLYNSQIIKELLFQNGTPFQTYYEFNPVVVPNCLDHLILVILLSIFPMYWVQKIVLVSLILSQALIFRKIILKINPANQLLSVLVLPFIFSAFFHEGFYNQHLSFIILYLYVYWKLCYQGDKNSLKYYAIHFLFSILVWFSNIVSFVLFVGMVGLEILVKEWKGKTRLVLVIKQNWKLVLVLLPTLWLTFNFMSNVKMETIEKSISLKDKFILLSTLDPITIFDTPGERKFTIPLAIILVVLALCSSKKSFMESSILQTIKLSTLVVFVAFWLLPNEAGAGMLSYRFATLFYLMGIIVLASFNYKMSYLLPAVVLISSIHIGLTFKRHNGTIRNYAKISRDFIEIGKDLPKGATVWPLAIQPNWFVGHSNNYVGIHSSIINFENYEAFNPWFPLRFKEDYKQANFLYNELSIKNELVNHHNIPADYLVLFGIRQENEKEIKKFLEKLNHPVLVSQLKDSSMRLIKLGGNKGNE